MIDLGSILTSNNGSSSIERLVSMYMEVERKPLDVLKSKGDQLTVQSGVFNDLRTRIKDLMSAADALSGASGSSFVSHNVSSSDATLATGSASAYAAGGTYVLDNIVLATAHRLQSAQLSSGWTSGGPSSFMLNGARVDVPSGATLTDVMNAINKASYAPGKGVSATVINVDSTHSRLVLTAQNTGSANAIKLADLSGSALSDLGIATTAASVAIAGVTASADSEDASYPAANLTDGTTGDASSWHGEASASSWSVTLDLGSSQTIDRLQWGRDQGGTATSGTPKSYTLEYSSDGGTTWTALKTVASNDLAAGGTKEDTFYPVTANMVRMTISATSDGAPPAIDEMRLYNDEGSLQTGAQLQAAGDASLTVNGVAVSEQASNTITTAVSGLTLKLAKEGGPVTLTVAPDSSVMTTRIQTFLDKLNALTDYLATKSQSTKGTDGNYTWGPLRGYSIFTDLKGSLARDMSASVPGLAAGAPSRIYDIGIQMDSLVHFRITDSSRLSNALSTNPAGVADLFGGESGIAALISKRLSPYVVMPTDGSGRLDYIDQELRSISDQQASIAGQTKSLNERLAIKEQVYMEQFTRLQALMIEATQQQQQIQSIFSATMGYTY